MLEYKSKTSPFKYQMMQILEIGLMPLKPEVK